MRREALWRKQIKEREDTEVNDEEGETRIRGKKWRKKEQKLHKYSKIREARIGKRKDKKRKRKKDKTNRNRKGGGGEPNKRETRKKKKRKRENI